MPSLSPALFNSAAVVFALVSAVLWALSARVKFQFGFDMDQALNISMKQASRLSAYGATFAALATLFQAIAMLITPLPK